MTQEYKQLLLRDLCARLPYPVKVKWDRTNGVYDIKNIDYCGNVIFYDREEFDSILLDEIKPYLRPMSSMTDKEENAYNSLNAYDGGCFPHTEDAFDWLNAHHFDYRNLIEKGLALEAPDGMYTTNNE